MPVDEPTALHADCSSCAGLCCVAPAFAASADFAIDKPAGHPCPNLDEGFRCTVHSRLPELGFPGCVAYDCFGAGQRVTQETFGGRSWRVAGPSMFSAFLVVQPLHELLWYLAEALALPVTQPFREELATARATIDRLAGSSPDELATLDLDAHRADVDVLLRRASALARAAAVRESGGGQEGAELARADRLGADLRGARLVGANLRGALLIGANLRTADLRGADLIGADLRGADLRGADLRGALFLTRTQLGGADGDRHTRLSPPHTRPARWN